MFVAAEQDALCVIAGLWIAVTLIFPVNAVRGHVNLQNKQRRVKSYLFRYFFEEQACRNSHNNSKTWNLHCSVI